jgi:alkanesulfonate monooxygenase SsuD/methylene tetrahydromethanopterin reductase-like flavin-dependent oxidoreductase (luciferase family)
MAVPLGVEAMKAYRDDISARLIAHGRKPDDCKVMFLIQPILGETQREAEQKFEETKARRADPRSIEVQLAVMSYFSGLDEPMPDLAGQVNGHQSSMTRYAKDSEDGKTLRELVVGHNTVESIPLVGTPDAVAAMMGEAMEEVGGDGLMFANPVNRRSFNQIADGLVPQLQKRGLTRREYVHETFRENLFEF